MLDRLSSAVRTRANAAAAAAVVVAVTIIADIVIAATIATTAAVTADPARSEIRRVPLESGDPANQGTPCVVIGLNNSLPNPLIDMNRDKTNSKKKRDDRRVH